jgi:DNA polymerase elongation subunit (family B)
MSLHFNKREKMILTFDIETLPTQDEAVIKQIAATIKPPGSIKKKESIDAWMDENFDQALKDSVLKTSFDGMYGRVACIAWSCEEGVVNSTLESHSEEECIRSFYESIEQNITKFCGHNLAGFDLPFLKHRSIILGIKPPSILLMAMNAKPWSDWFADTMLMWSSDKSKMVSMDALCRAFGIPGSGDFNGSMVAETWLVDPQKVIDYCVDDVRRTVEIYKRMTFEK